MKKKLLAFLCALVLLTGALPAASANQTRKNRVPDPIARIIIP